MWAYELNCLGYGFVYFDLFAIGMLKFPKIVNIYDRNLGRSSLSLQNAMTNTWLLPIYSNKPVNT